MASETTDILAWDAQYDVVILGCGVAGMAAAITAGRKGASVLIAEKQPRDGHTCALRMSSGIWMTVTDPVKAATYFEACFGGHAQPDSIRALVEHAHALPDWFKSVEPRLSFVKVNTAENPQFAGSEVVEVLQPRAPDGRDRPRMHPDAGSGKDLYDAFAREMVALDVTVAWESPVQRLIRDSAQRVVGAELSTPAGLRRIGAKRGTILATGGFEHDEEAKRTYLMAHPTHFSASPANTGDGLRIAQEIGADLWHMNQMAGRAAMGFPVGPEGRHQGFFVNMIPPGAVDESQPGYVIVDRFGKRFGNEHKQTKFSHSFFYDLLVFDSDRGSYPRIPCFWFFDEKRRRSGPVTFRHIGPSAVGIYDWSQDNKAEIEAGWITAGATIEEVARRAGIEDVPAAVRSIEEYNATCGSGKADSFGRPSHSMGMITEPPFYCVKLWPGGPFTTGGPRRDVGGRIIDVRGKPIPGLYGAGELGQVSGLLYPSDGFGITEALCSGQIAAETIMAQS